ncbi:hypothetical protein COB52_04850 [Candidatus Kaiserbacteria bacterium]|nr:MAG: hypothetical protein COB52_04850 [Candidatus Kaiserbacteria bacterium]
MARILDQVSGHGDVLKTLQRALSEKRFPATSIFVGASGIGKKRIALGMAQALICEQNSVGCGNCPSCQRIENQQSESLLIVEPESTQLKVEQSRQVIRFVSLRQIGRARVVIIDGAERLNAAASNSLLKTLEEPPEQSYFILISKSIAALLPTIRSRAQTFRFSPLSPAEIKEIGDFPDWVYDSCGGSMEQAEVLSGSGELLELRNAGLALLRKALCAEASVYGEVKDLVKDKESALFLIQSIRLWVRDLFRSRSGGQTSAMFGDEHTSWSKKFVLEADIDVLNRIWGWTIQLERDVLGNVDRQLSFENFFLSCARHAAKT